jgi:SAM-dependent methyltransferase
MSLGEWAWRLRNRITFPVPPLKHTLGTAPHPLSENPPTRLSELERHYDLNRWGQVCNRAEWQENLYILDLLDRLLGRHEGMISPCLDIGCKNGVYFPALATYSGSGWDGIELDAFRRYLNLASRRDHGRFMARPFDCHYIAGSLLELNPAQPYRLITWFLPFVAEGPLSAWGLPRCFYQPVALLARAWQLLAPDGTLLIINQGEWESQVQRRLFTACAVEVEFLGQTESEFSPFKQPRYAWRIHKPTMN